MLFNLLFSSDEDFEYAIEGLLIFLVGAFVIGIVSFVLQMIKILLVGGCTLFGAFKAIQNYFFAIKDVVTGQTI